MVPLQTNLNLKQPITTSYYIPNKLIPSKFLVLSYDISKNITIRYPIKCSILFIRLKIS